MEETHNSGSLSRRVIKGGFWLFSIRIVNKLLSLIRLIILARILSPNDFGLMGIALLTMMTIETFSTTGFDNALIQKEEDPGSYLDCAWTFTVLRGFVLFGIINAVAPQIAAFFAEPHAELIIRILGISMLFNSFKSIGMVIFWKELDFYKLFVFRLSGAIADFTVAVSAALILKNVWALVFGTIASSIVMAIVSFMIHPYRPRLNFDWRKALELFNYGRWILGSTILFFLLNQGGDILVGKLLGASMLGFYHMAMRIPNMIANELSHPIVAVTFPAFSKLQNNVDDLRKAYLKVLQVAAFAIFPVMGGIIIMASDFTRIFLGEKWMPIVPAMQVLTVWASVFSLNSATWPLFKAIGRPDLETKLKLGSLIILVAMIFPLTSRFGIVGTALAVFFNVSLVSPVAFYLVMRIIRCRLIDIVKLMLYPLLSILVMVASLVFIKTRFIPEVTLISFPFLVVVGAAVYFGVMQLIDISTNYGMRTIVTEHLVPMRKKAQQMQQRDGVDP